MLTVTLPFFFFPFFLDHADRGFWAPSHEASGSSHPLAPPLLLAHPPPALGTTPGTALGTAPGSSLGTAPGPGQGPGQGPVTEAATKGLARGGRQGRGAGAAQDAFGVEAVRQWAEVRFGKAKAGKQKARILFLFFLSFFLSFASYPFFFMPVPVKCTQYSWPLPVVYPRRTAIRAWRLRARTRILFALLTLDYCTVLCPSPVVYPR